MLCAALPAVPSPLRSIFPGPCLMQHACALFASFWVCCNEGSLCACQAAVDSLVPQGRQIPVSHCPYLPCDSFHLQEDGAQTCCRGRHIGLSSYSLSSSLFPADMLFTR